jgi:hypothetical protein
MSGRDDHPWEIVPDFHGQERRCESCNYEGTDHAQRWGDVFREPFCPKCKSRAYYEVSDG